VLSGAVSARHAVHGGWPGIVSLQARTSSNADQLAPGDWRCGALLGLPIIVETCLLGA